jgi:hypothetical protein
VTLSACWSRSTGESVGWDGVGVVPEGDVPLPEGDGPLCTAFLWGGGGVLSNPEEKEIGHHNQVRCHSSFEGEQVPVGHSNRVDGGAGEGLLWPGRWVVLHLPSMDHVCKLHVKEGKGLPSPRLSRNRATSHSVVSMTVPEGTRPPWTLPCQRDPAKAMNNSLCSIWWGSPWRWRRQGSWL